MDLKKTLISIYKEAKEQFGLQKAPKLYLRDDVENSKNIFGKTAYYNPSNTSIVLYITNRHPKDICRSFCHELIHHYQNERGDLEMGDTSSPTYAQDDPHMRKMEMEAYLKGNMLLRDFEDKVKYKNKML